MKFEARVDAGTGYAYCQKKNWCTHTKITNPKQLTPSRCVRCVCNVWTGSVKRSSAEGEEDDETGEVSMVRRMRTAMGMSTWRTFFLVIKGVRLHSCYFARFYDVWKACIQGLCGLLTKDSSRANGTTIRRKLNSIPRVVARSREKDVSPGTALTWSFPTQCGLRTKCKATYCVGLCRSEDASAGTERPGVLRSGIYFHGIVRYLSLINNCF
jgi:hypothetical protein